MECISSQVSSEMSYLPFRDPLFAIYAASFPRLLAFDIVVRDGNSPNKVSLIERASLRPIFLSVGYLTSKDPSTVT